MRILLTAFLLSACASVGSITDSKPSAVYLSAKSPIAAEECLSDALDFLAGGPAVSRTSGGTRLAFTSGNDTYLVVTVKPSASGSAIEVHQQYRYAGAVRRRVEACV